MDDSTGEERGKVERGEVEDGDEVANGAAVGGLRIDIVSD
jgi:hypothetical protein